MRFLIGGPGRSGSTLLLSILEQLGMTTYFDTKISVDANAGNEITELTSFLQSGKDVAKSPFLGNLLRDHSGDLPDDLMILIPIRNRHTAVQSRIQNELDARLKSEVWMTFSWEQYGILPGGALYSNTFSSISAATSESLWDQLYEIACRNIPVLLLDFDKFNRDFDYLWEVLSPFLSENLDKGDAREKVESILDLSKVTIQGDSQHAELEAAHNKIRKLYLELEELREERFSVAGMSGYYKERVYIFLKKLGRKLL